MHLDNLCAIIAEVELMGGDPVSEILAPSEVRAIAEAVLALGTIASPRGEAATPAANLWMQTIPPFMHDCFSA
ncbi:hypothetical protein [Sphingomonas sp. Leaf10]|jgi:hypothetical protein|uniref:hypothetical protein n=1 Tax=Sphingomonas sp. Leaf10 TaxID=1735676 RepID=UPI0006FEA580|nr:hypothetical protein [Sphingomonas sp. Leaf10]KQM30560.1 hypothetical protein ASE59_08300 [Sphingomonas sp. Leaf10]